MPATWKSKPFKAPLAKTVILGYIEAFDPDILVQFSKEVPDYIAALGLEIIKPGAIWQGINEERNLSPKFGLGIFELLNTIFDEHFKYKTKYPIKIIFPNIPSQFSLFWASLFGEIPSEVLPTLERNYFKPLEIEVVDFQSDKLLEIIKGEILFPRRIAQSALSVVNHAGFRREAYVYFLDAKKTEDIIDFWNLRAMGKQVVPMPKQFKEDPQFRQIVLDFLKDHRRPWPHNPQVCDTATMIRARSCTIEEMQEFGKTLKIERLVDDQCKDPFFSFQHWYPRVWDEWARDKDGAVPCDVYGEEELSIEFGESSELKIQLKPLLPEFAEKYSYHGEPRCANEISLRFYGSAEYLAEVLPKSSGANVERAISGLTSLRGDWRVGRNGLVKLVKNNFAETREIPTAESIMSAFLTDFGWKPKLSPPGLLAKQIYRKFDGLPIVFRNEKLLGLLEHMNGGSVGMDGTPREKHKINQERDLSVGEVKSRLGSASRRGDFYEYLSWGFECDVLIAFGAPGFP
jgi:hypothetical protein